MVTPLVSVIIPNYNYSQYLREAVDSVLSQAFTNLEIIVVDDGSQDNSREVIESYGDLIKPIFQRNQGVAVARNVGVDESNGKYVAFLDADDVWFPEKIEAQMDRFLSDSSLGLVHVAVQDIDANGENLKTHGDGLEGDISEELLLFNKPVILGGGSGIVVRRDAFEAVGGFDPEMSTSADWDLFYRISHKYKVGFVPEILLKYRVHGSNMHGNIKAMEMDMLRGYQKAFESGAKANVRISYGNLHKVLSGSYFHSRRYRSFLRHAVKCVWNSPSNITYFATFPVRRFFRKT